MNPTKPEGIAHEMQDVINNDSIALRFQFIAVAEIINSNAD